MLKHLAVACIAVPLMCIVKVCARIISQDWDNPVRRVARLVGGTWGAAVDPQKNQTLTPVYMVRYAPAL